MSKRNTDLKRFLPTGDRLIPNDDLIGLLKKQMYTISQLKKMGVTEMQVQELKALGYKLMYQYDSLSKEFVYYILEKGENPFTVLPFGKGQTTLKIAEMSDIHIGSNEVDNEEIILLLTYLWQSGYRILSISGDLTDNVGVYHGQKQNLDLATVDRQVNTAVAILSLFDFDYYACSGNHDTASSKDGAASTLAMIEEKMVSKGKSFTYLKSYVGYLVFGDCAIEISHMDGARGGSQSETYASQKMMDAMFKTSLRVGTSNVNAVKIFDRMIPIVKLITGHYHALTKFVYGDVVCESPLSTQHTTDFINRRGLRSKTGARVSEITVQNGKCISEKGSIIFGVDVQDIYETEIQFARSSRRLGLMIKSATKKSDGRLLKGIKIDNEKINKAVLKLRKKGYMSFDELGLSLDEIGYINNKFNYNIYIEDETVVWKTDDSNSYLIYSPLPESGIVNYLEISNALIGSKFFSEKAFRYMLDCGKKQHVEHINFGGDMIWGLPPKQLVEHTKIFDGMQQVEEVVRILSDYPNFHYYSINGVREKSFIEAASEKQRINPMLEVSNSLGQKGIKFVAINSNKCDFVVFGMVFRMINLLRKTQTPYTRDYDIVIAQRNLMAKLGSQLLINDKSYNIGAIFYSSVVNTQETHSGSMYITTTGGPSYDPQNVSNIIQSNCECAIVNAYVKKGTIVKFEREIIMPPL